MKKSILVLATLALAASAQAGDIVCKAKPQPNETPANQVVGSYVLKELKNKEGRADGSFALYYKGADGVAKLMTERLFLSVRDKSAEQAEAMYIDGYLEAADTVAGYQPIPLQKVGYVGRVYIGFMSGPHAGTDFMIGFLLGNAPTSQDADLLEMFGVIESATQESYFLCEKLSTNPKRLPAQRRAG